MTYFNFLISILKFIFLWFWSVFFFQYYFSMILNFFPYIWFHFDMILIWYCGCIASLTFHLSSLLRGRWGRTRDGERGTTGFVASDRRARSRPGCGTRPRAPGRNFEMEGAVEHSSWRRQCASRTKLCTSVSSRCLQTSLTFASGSYDRLRHMDCHLADCGHGKEPLPCHTLDSAPPPDSLWSQMSHCGIKISSMHFPIVALPQSSWTQSDMIHVVFCFVCCDSDIGHAMLYEWEFSGCKSMRPLPFRPP